MDTTSIENTSNIKYTIQKYFNSLSVKELHKVKFIINALENGWTIQKQKEKYIFRKKHKNKNKIKKNNYLYKFVDKNLKL